MTEERGRFPEFIGRWPQELRHLWDGLPPATRTQLERGLSLLPGDAKGWRRLVEQAAEQLKITTGDKHQVAIVGPANVGKSTLFNQLIRSRGDRAAVSAVAGTTRVAQQADAGLFAVIDTPGADVAGSVGEEERQRALAAAETADVLVILFDATHGIRPAERALFDELVGLGKPTVVAVNKMDLVRRERTRVLAQIATTLGLTTEQLLPLSAKDGTGVERVLLAVAKTEPGIVAALGAALPAYRWKLSQTVIGRTASTAAAIAVTPIPIIDFIPLIGIQSAMVLSLARIYGQRITAGRARELLLTFGLGLLGRGLFYELSKLGGPPGWLLSAGIAVGTTVAMGYAVASWFERGQRLSQESLGRIARSSSRAVVDHLKDLGGRKPNRMTLQQRVDQALQELPEREPPAEP